MLDDTVDFDCRLRHVGVPSTLRLGRDLPHGFFGTSLAVCFVFCLSPYPVRLFLSSTHPPTHFYPFSRAVWDGQDGHQHHAGGRVVFVQADGGRTRGGGGDGGCVCGGGGSGGGRLAGAHHCVKKEREEDEKEKGGHFVSSRWGKSIDLILRPPPL